MEQQDGIWIRFNLRKNVRFVLTGFLGCLIFRLIFPHSRTNVVDIPIPLVRKIQLGLPIVDNLQSKMIELLPLRGRPQNEMGRLLRCAARNSATN